MKNQVQPFLAAVLLSGATSLGLAGHAVAADPPEEVVAEDGWYSHGFVMLGGLVFIDEPPVEDRSKFEEYGEVTEGFIVPKVHLEFGSLDGLHAIEIYGDDLTWNNRNVSARLSTAGQHYLDLEYDETPHLYRSRAWTLFNGVGSDTLTVDNDVQADLQDAQFGDTDAGSVYDEGDIAGIVEDNLQPTRLEVDRKTGKVAFRMTPSPEWDINLHYSREERDGAQAMGSVLATRAAEVCHGPCVVGVEEAMLEVAKPVDFTTQNFGASVQYKADLGDSRHWITNLAYAGSIFDNANDSLTYDDPFRLDYTLSPYAIAEGVPVGEDGSPWGRMSLEPDNQAHRFTLQTAADLSDMTRFTGTVSYNMMRQDEKLLPWTINYELYDLDPLDLPADSADAAIDTLTINAKLTTRALHPDVTNTFRYRYYSLDNDTPHLYVPERIAFDSEFEDNSYRILAPGYVKQNASFDTVWRQSDTRTFGLLLGWEQYDRDIGREADVTDEYSVKGTADLHPHDWMTVRGSALYAQRRYDEYDYSRVDFGDNTAPQNFEGMRKFSMSDRNRTKLNGSVAVDVTDGLTLTGLGGWRYDDYGEEFGLDPASGEPEMGLSRDKFWHAGIELNYMASERTGIYGSYVHEAFDRRILNTDRGWVVDIEGTADTFVGGFDVALFDDRAKLKLGYTISKGEEDDKPDGFPVVTNQFQRFDASFKFDLPEATTNGTGLTKAFAKIGYAYERNRVTNWANDVTPYNPDPNFGSGSAVSLFLAGKDPNYTAQIVTLVLGLGW